MKKRTFFQRALAWVLVFIMVIGGVTVPGINTLQANASALGESGGETNSPEINGSGAGGETTGAATPETYTVDIVSESNEYYPEEPVTLTAQVKNSSGNIISMDGITVTWSITTGADSASLGDASGSSTHLTVNKDAAKGTLVEVKVQCKNGDSSVDCEKTLSLNTSVRETVTVSGKVYDSYAPGVTHTAIPGAEITFEQSAAQVNKQVKVTAGNDGSYSVTLYKGIPYSVHIVKSDYQVFKQTGLIFLADTNNNDIHMEISGSLAISGTNQIDEIFVDQTVQLTAEVTGKLGNVSWEIISANKNDATLSPVAGSGGKNADFKALKAGSYEVKVSAHGIGSDSIVINVKKKTTTLKVWINPEKDGNWYSGVAIKAALTDGDKELSNQAIGIYIDGTKVGSMTTDNNGDATYTWKEAKGVVKDTYSIEVKYGGNTDYYSEAVWGSANYSLSKLGQSFEFDGSNTVDNLTYGDVSYIKLKDILPDSSVTEADRENYKASTNFTFEVNDAGKDFVEVGAFDSNEGGYPVKIKKGGVSNVKITVTQEANEFYNASQKELTITSINKKEVSLVDVQAEEKTYDGLTDNIKVTAKLNLADIADVDKNAAENVKMLSIANGSVDKADAASQAAVTAKFEMPQSLADKYYLKDNGEIPANTVFVKIKPAPLSLTLGNASIDYSLIPDVSALKYEDNVEKISVSGFIGDDLINNPLGFQLPNIYIDTEALGTEFEVEKSYDVLKAEENTGNSTNNYYFDFDNQSPGKLTLLVESVKTYSDYIAYDDSGSKSASQDSDTLIYYGDNQPVVKFKILSEKEKNYSQIILVKDGQVSGNIAETGIEDLGTNDSEVSYQAYLINDKGTKKTSVFDLPAFKRDGKKPNVSITIAEDNKAFDEFLETLTFGLYHNTSMKADISVADPVVEGLSSGVRSWSYYIAEVDEDVTFTPQATDHTLTEEEFKNRFPDAAFETIDVNSDDDLKKTISIGDKGNNNYIVFVIAVDKVGNCCLYGSNGVIIENVKPGEIVVQYDTESINEKGYFNSNVNLKVTASENTLESSILSGIASIKYKVEKDGKTVTTDGQGGSFNEVLFYSDVPNTTLQDLKNDYANITRDTTIPMEDGSVQTKNESKVVRATFTATDFAGNNTNEDKIVEFVIDPVKPNIDFGYNKESQIYGTEGNEIYYYNDEVVLTTTITERFLDIDKDVKYYIHSSDPMTNSADPITFGDLRNSENWEKYGIKDVVIDHSEENRTDQSVSTITITFDGERDYNVWTSVTDKAGNNNKKEARKFVIDKTAPIVTVSYKDIKSGRTFVPSKEEAHRTYLNSESEDGIEVEIKINEKNFLKDDVVLTITAKDINNIAIDIPASTWEANEEVHTYSFILNKDANYTLDIKYMDLAKNLAVYTDGMTQKSTYDTDYFTLDREIPVGKITVKQLIFNNEEKEQSWLQSFWNQ